MNPSPWYSYPLLLTPKRIARNLEKRVRAGLVQKPPNTWQLCLGVARMWHRTVFRTETIGSSPEGKVRNNWRARLLYYKPLRLPFLFATGAITPWDLTGLASSKDQIIRHLLTAHHDGLQFVFDFELLLAHPGALEELHEQVLAVIQEHHPRSQWYRDLCVFAGYHETLLSAVEDALAGGLRLDEATRCDPDLSLEGYLRWCESMPASPKKTAEAIRQGTFDISGGIPASAGNHLRTTEGVGGRI